MAEKTTVAVHVKQLLSGMAGHAERHLAEVDSDLHQTRLLLEQAIGKLTSSFIAIHDAVSAQQQMIEELEQGQSVAASDIKNAKLRSEEIRQHVDAAMIGLQFQDMTDQLINRTNQRIAGIRGAFETLCVNSDAMTAESDAATLASLLERLDELLRQQSEGLDRTVWKSVCQTDMGSGGVDLF